jgi:hypothetical protein
MSVSIELPCGCRITCSDVLSICLEHSIEYQRKRIEDAKAHEAYEKLLRAAQQHRASQE